MSHARPDSPIDRSSSEDVRARFEVIGEADGLPDALFEALAGLLIANLGAEPPVTNDTPPPPPRSSKRTRRAVLAQPP
jgi:hypothetical protein